MRLLVIASIVALSACGGEDVPTYTLTMDCADGRQIEWAPEQWWTDGSDRHDLGAGEETPPDEVLDECGASG